MWCRIHDSPHCYGFSLVGISTDNALNITASWWASCHKHALLWACLSSSVLPLVRLDLLKDRALWSRFCSYVGTCKLWSDRPVNLPLRSREQMVLLEPFSKLSFWSFNRSLGSSLLWIQFLFSIFPKLQTLKLIVMLIVQMSNTTLIFHLTSPIQSLSSLDLRTVPAQCARLLLFNVVIQRWPANSCQNQWLYRMLLPSFTLLHVAEQSLYYILWCCLFSQADLLVMSQLSTLSYSDLISNDFRSFHSLACVNTGSRTSLCQVLSRNIHVYLRLLRHHYVKCFFVHRYMSDYMIWLR